MIAATASGLVALSPGVAAAESEVTIEAGVNGQFSYQALIPVTVTVRADEVIDGTLRISRSRVDDYADLIEIEQPISIASGTTKEYALLLPSSWEIGRIEATVLDGDDEVASDSVALRPKSGEFVGVLPRLAAAGGELPPTVDLPEGLGRASLVVVPETQTALGAAGFDPYDQIVTGGADLAALDATTRDDLFGWVSAGGRLLLDDDEALALLPADWALDGVTYRVAGLGEVRFVDGAASDGDWEAIVEPSIEATGYNNTEMMIDSQSELARRANLDFPSIAPLTAILLGYAVIVGPLLFLVLRRLRRLTLGWIAVPLAAIIVTAVVAIAGSGRLRSGTASAGTFVQLGPTGGFAVSSVLGFASNTGELSLDLPAGWAPSSQSGNNMWWGDEPPVGRDLALSWDGERGAELRTDLEPNQGKTALFIGPSVDAAGLSVSAELVGAQIEVEVRNDADIAFSDVGVFVGNKQKNLGHLEPGESASWSTAPPRDLRMTWETRGTRVWGEPTWDDRGMPTPVDRDVEGIAAEMGTWGTAGMHLGLFPQGMVRVVGWTDELASPFVGDGSAITAVSTVAPVTGRVSIATVRVETVREPFGMMQATNQVVRYLLPPSYDGGPLVLAGADDVGAEGVAFWTGAEWIEIDDLDDLEDPDSIPIPSDAVRDGTVLVRAEIDMNMGSQGTPFVTAGGGPGWFDTDADQSQSDLVRDRAESGTVTDQIGLFADPSDR